MAKLANDDIETRQVTRYNLGPIQQQDKIKQMVKDNYEIHCLLKGEQVTSGQGMNKIIKCM